MKRKLTAEQETKRVERLARQKELFARLAKMNAVDRAKLASQMPVVTCNGRMLSTANMCLVAMQFPVATVVGGFRQWLSKGRCVRKGEHGMVIRVPAGKRAANGADEQGAAATEDAVASVYFIAGTVFDVSQTEELNCEIADCPQCERNGQEMECALA